MRLETIATRRPAAMLTSSHYRSANGYRVPQRFSVADILAMLTVFGLLFGGLRCAGAPPVFYVFFGTQAMVVCLVQMRFGKVPRGASIAVGCLFLPLLAWFLVAAESPYLPARFADSWRDNFVRDALPAAVLFGGLLGFLTGATVAGVFLVMDMADGLIRRAARRRARLP